MNFLVEDPRTLLEVEGMGRGLIDRLEKRGGGGDWRAEGTGTRGKARAYWSIEGDGKGEEGDGVGEKGRD